MNFVVYNSQGKILRCGICPPKDFSKQANTTNGEKVIESKGVDDREYEVKNSKIVKKKEVYKKKIKPKRNEDNQRARISITQWKKVLQRLDDLEKK